MKFAVECPGEGWVLGKSEESKKKQSLSIKNKIKNE